MAHPREAPKVSVIVPVYNPGTHIDDCIASILGQTMAPGELEAIFVDDGSTDGTGERLDRVADEHAHVRTIHIENSGWPGRPRNVGIEAARGAFYYFVDNDDRLGEEAIERLYATALRTGADIVIGKLVGHRRGVPRELFRRNRDHATLRADAALLTLLTPHKLFRADLVQRHGLRFPEGRRRLEDHAFVVPAYFAAHGIAVLSDYPCYHWIRRDDGGNASSRPPDEGYWRNLAEVLDLVEAHTEPGGFRDRLLAHWYRSKVLRRLDGDHLPYYAEPYRAALVRDVGDLARARFGAAVAMRLEPTHRIRDRLLRADRPDALAALAEHERTLAARTSLHASSWEDGVLRLVVDATLVDAEGRPLRFPRRDGRISWPVPDVVRAVPDADVDVTRDLGRSTLRAFVRLRGQGVEYLLPATSDARVTDEGDAAGLRVRGVVRVDVTAAAAGTALPAGVWDVFVLVASCGLTRAVRLPVAAVAPPGPGVVGDPPRTVVPYRTVAGNLSLDVDQASHTLPATGRRFGRVTVEDHVAAVAVEMPGVHVDAGARRPAQLVLAATQGDARVIAGAALREAPTGARLDARVTLGADGVAPGRWLLGLRLGPRESPLPLRLDVPRHGRPRLVRRGDTPATVRVKRALLRIPPVRAVAQARRGR